MAIRADRPSGLYRLEDVAVDYQLSQPGPARDSLAAELAPLHDKPELLTTLRTYFRAGLNRRRTAAARHVHPNTIDYRLRRIADLTGLDATDPARTAHIQAALTALEASADQRT